MTWFERSRGRRGRPSGTWNRLLPFIGRRPFPVQAFDSIPPSSLAPSNFQKIPPASPPPPRRILFVEINKKKNLLSSLFLPRKETLFSIIDKPIEGKRMKMESNVTFDCRPRTKANRISSMIQLDGTIGAFTKRIISGRAGARLTRSQSTSSKRATSGARAT